MSRRQKLAVPLALPQLYCVSVQVLLWISSVIQPAGFDKKALPSWLAARPGGLFDLSGYINTNPAVDQTTLQAATGVIQFRLL